MAGTSKIDGNGGAPRTSVATVADALASMAGERPRSLVSKRAWETILTLASGMPAPLVSKLYLECPLADGGRRTDLIVGLEHEGRDLVAGANPVLAMATPPGDRVWEAVRDLCRQWAGDEAAWSGVARCWLELDLPASADLSSWPTPGLFVDLERDARPAELLASMRVAPWIEALTGHAGEALWGNLRQCAAAVPAGAFICSLGFFPARGGDRARICVADLRVEDCAAFLRTVGWPGAGSAVRPWLDRIAARPDGWPNADRIALHLDVGQRVESLLGLELRMGRRSQLAGTLGEGPFLDALVAAGLATAAERRDLVGWPLARLGRLPATVWRSVIVRRVNHLKICFGAAGEPFAKAYLSVHGRPWPIRGASGGGPGKGIGRGDLAGAVNKTT